MFLYRTNCKCNEIGTNEPCEMRTLRVEDGK